MRSVYQKTRDTYKKIAPQYIKDSEHLEPIEREPFAKLFSKGASILDVGCGGGRDTKFFTKKGLQVTAVDTSLEFIRAAKRRAHRAHFIHGDLLTAKLSKEGFDGIWAQAVLLHLTRPDVRKAIKKFYTYLKPGGILHIRVKKGKGERLEKEELSGWNERFYTYFSKKELTEMLRGEGFKIGYSLIAPDQLKRKKTTWIAMWAKKPR